MYDAASRSYVMVVDRIYRTLSLVHLMAVPLRKNRFIPRLLMFLVDADIGCLFVGRFQSFYICLFLFGELVVVDVTAYLIHTQSKHLFILFRLLLLLHEIMLLLFSYVFGSRFRPLNLLIISLNLSLLLSTHNSRHDI